jgi:hypothetical protein
VRFHRQAQVHNNGSRGHDQLSPACGLSSPKNSYRSFPDNAWQIHAFSVRSPSTKSASVTPFRERAAEQNSRDVTLEGDLREKRKAKTSTTASSARFREAFYHQMKSLLRFFVDARSPRTTTRG